MREVITLPIEGSMRPTISQEILDLCEELNSLVREREPMDLENSEKAIESKEK